MSGQNYLYCTEKRTCNAFNPIAESRFPSGLLAQSNPSNFVGMKRAENGSWKVYNNGKRFKLRGIVFTCW